MNLPPTIKYATPSIIVLSDDKMFIPLKDATKDAQEKWPDLFIEYSMPEIKEAAIHTLRQILTLTYGMQLFSFQELTEAATDKEPNQ